MEEEKKVYICQNVIRRGENYYMPGDEIEATDDEVKRALTRALKLKGGRPKKK